MDQLFGWTMESSPRTLHNSLVTVASQFWSKDLDDSLQTQNNTEP